MSWRPRSWRTGSPCAAVRQGRRRRRLSGRSSTPYRLRCKRMRLRSLAKPALVVFLGFVLYVIASNVGAGWLYVIVSALAGVVLISLPLPWLGVRHVGITRRAPVVATAGEPFECTLEIENNGRPPRYMP